MDVKEYIASGILDSYIVDALSEQERKEVESMASIYPEVRSELDSLSDNFEDYLSTTAIQPSTHLRDRIMNQIGHLEQKQTEQTKIIALEKAEQRGLGKYIYYVAAASLLLMIFGYYIFNSKLGEKNKELSAVNEELKKVKDKAHDLEIGQTDLEAELLLLKDPANRLVDLKGTDTHHDNSVMVCWNKTSREVFLSFKTLPAPTDGKQYQLWAIVDGKPIDMGVLDHAHLNKHFKRDGAIDQAQSFAITLEPKGGSETPHLDRLIVIGSI